jgi:flagellin-like protein
VVNLKKAVSPLIATIVLISFTIAIGSLVINWGKQFITAQTQSLEQAGVECNKENIQIVRVIANVTSSGRNAVTNFTIFVRNIGDVAFELQSVNVYTDTNVYSNSSVDFSLDKGESKSFSVVFNFNASKEKVDYIELTSKKCPNGVYYGYNIEVKE